MYKLRTIALILPISLILSACGDDSSGPGILQFNSATYSVLENADSITLNVVRIGGSTGTVTVDFNTSDGTAVAGADYTPVAGTLTFSDGITSQSLAISILDNADADGNKTFNTTLANPTGGATLGSPIEAVVTILDEETTAALYDFESLNEAPIDGQDNWQVDITDAAASIVMDTTPVNGTKVVRPESTVLGLAGQAELTRVNDSNFSFTSFTTDQGEIWFEATGDDNALFALGQDLTGDGFLRPVDDELGVPFGIWERNFAIFAGNSLMVRRISNGLGTGNEATDWYRLRLQIDFAANGGEGAGSMAYMNLTNGETNFTPIAELQDINLGLISNGAPDPSGWNAMFLLLRIDATNIPKADNLLPDANAML